MLALGFLDLLWVLSVLALLAFWIVRLCRKARAWPFLAASVTGAALLIGFNWTYFYGDGTIIDTPTTAQVTGTWSGDYGETLTLRPNGTFTAEGVEIDDTSTDTSVPPPKAPVTGGGTWSIEPGSDASGEGGVDFTFTSCNASCPGSFELYAQTSSPVSGRGAALFYYIGDPDDDNQYTFVRQAAPAPAGR